MALASSGDVGGYLRVMTRPDFQGGSGQLGHWNLYGRLLNEGPFVALEARLNLLEQEPGSNQVWTSVHARIEGGSIANADVGNGGLANLRLAQLYVQAGNVILPKVTWQVGTLQTWMGDLGLYDMRPTTLFDRTLGVSGRYADDKIDVVVGLGDSGYGVKGLEYNTLLTAGANLRYRPVAGLEFGAGGQVMYEPAVIGNRFAPHDTPGVTFEDFARGEVVSSWLEDNPNQAINFPDPEPVSALSYKAVGYVGFGGWGPFTWNSLYISYERSHPQNRFTETFDDVDYDIYATSLTDQRTALFIGDELQMTLVPNRLDLAVAALFADHRDGDNDITPTDYDRWYWSTVLRLQTYVTPQVHFLFESSVAREFSRNGSTFRNHFDSLFENTEGTADFRGLEYGDDDKRTTWQGKGGIVLNPLGPGVYVRPSLRILYGVQYSTQNNAFGNSFVETLDQYNDFGNVERHWHHVLAIETEAWF